MYEHIVVGADQSASSKEAVQHAVALAGATGATLHLVHAYRPPSQAPIMAPEMAGIAAASDSDSTAAANQLVESLAEEARRSGVTVCPHVVIGPAADVLCEVAKAEGADVVVVGNKGMKGARRVLGSVPNTVAHKAPCAVLVVPTVS